MLSTTFLVPFTTTVVLLEFSPIATALKFGFKFVVSICISFISFDVSVPNFIVTFTLVWDSSLTPAGLDIITSYLFSIGVILIFSVC